MYALVLSFLEEKRFVILFRKWLRLKKKKNAAYPLVYLLVSLTLTLLVATATMKRAFSAMKIVNN
jgi:hypothetical protein